MKGIIGITALAGVLGATVATAAVNIAIENNSNYSMFITPVAYIDGEEVILRGFDVRPESGPVIETFDIELPNNESWIKIQKIEISKLVEPDHSILVETLTFGNTGSDSPCDLTQNKFVAKESPTTGQNLGTSLISLNYFMEDESGDIPYHAFSCDLKNTFVWLSENS